MSSMAYLITVTYYMNVADVIGKLVNISLLMTTSLYMVVGLLYHHKCVQTYCHSYMKPTRGQSILNKEHTLQCIGQEWTTISTT